MFKTNSSFKNASFVNHKLPINKNRHLKISSLY
jgi:hypothetical protein